MIKEGDIVTVEGGVTIYNTIPTVYLTIRIMDALDDSEVWRLKWWLGTLEADIEKTYQEMNQGDPLTWDTSGHAGKFYVLVEILLPEDIEGKKEDREYFDVDIVEFDGVVIELEDEMQVIEVDADELEVIEVE